LVGVVILGLLYYFKSAFIVATVNGEPISRLTYIHEMEHQIGQPGLKSGTQALNTVVTKTLILQEAKKKNVTVSDDEINAELSKVEQSLKGSGQTLDQALASEGITRKDYSEQIKFQKLVEKLAGANVTVTDKEVEEYMTQNKESLPTTTEASEAAALKTQVKNQLKSQKESSKIQAWLQGLQKNAKINYYSDVAPQTSL
jgi:foldase protein PrsA